MMKILNNNDSKYKLLFSRDSFKHFLGKLIQLSTIPWGRYIYICREERTTMIVNQAAE